MDHSLDRAKKNAFLMIINTDIILVYEMMLVHIKKRMWVVFVYTSCQCLRSSVYLVMGEQDMENLM